MNNSSIEGRRPTEMFFLFFCLTFLLGPNIFSYQIASHSPTDIKFKIKVQPYNNGEARISYSQNNLVVNTVGLYWERLFLPIPTQPLPTRRNGLIRENLPIRETLLENDHYIKFFLDYYKEEKKINKPQANYKRFRSKYHKEVTNTPCFFLLFITRNILKKFSTNDASDVAQIAATQIKIFLDNPKENSLETICQDLCLNVKGPTLAVILLFEKEDLFPSNERLAHATQPSGVVPDGFASDPKKKSRFCC